MLNITRHDDVEAFDFHGLQIREIQRSDRSSLAEIDVAPGTIHPKARSTASDKIYTCLEGSISFVVDGQNVVLSERETLVIDVDTWFEYSNLGSKMARLLLTHTPAFNLEAEEFSD